MVGHARYMRLTTIGVRPSAGSVASLNTIGSKTTSVPACASRKTPKCREKRSDNAKPDSLSRKTARPMAVGAEGVGGAVTPLPPKAPANHPRPKGKPAGPTHQVDTGHLGPRDVPAA